MISQPFKAVLHRKDSLTLIQLTYKKGVLQILAALSSISSASFLNIRNYGTAVLFFRERYVPQEGSYCLRRVLRLTALRGRREGPYCRIVLRPMRLNSYPLGEHSVREKTQARRNWL